MRVTGGGQIIAVVLMLVGITLLSALTASIAALFVEQDEEPDAAAILITQSRSSLRPASPEGAHGNSGIGFVRVAFRWTDHARFPDHERRSTLE